MVRIYNGPDKWVEQMQPHGALTVARVAVAVGVSSIRYSGSLRHNAAAIASRIAVAMPAHANDEQVGRALLAAKAKAEGG